MDVSVCLERRGARVTRRAIERRRLPSCQRVTPQDAITFLRERYRVEVV
jgi:large subunit ribosomal protein L5